MESAAILVFVVWLALGLFVARMAINRGRSFFGWWIFSVFFTPFLGALYVFVLDYAGECPLCHGRIHPKASRCMHCAADIARKKGRAGPKLERGPVMPAKGTEVTDTKGPGAGDGN